MLKYLLIAIAALVGASLQSRAEDQKTTNDLQKARPAEPTSTGLQQQNNEPTSTGLQQQTKEPTTTNLSGQAPTKPTTNNLENPPTSAPSK